MIMELAILNLLPGKSEEFETAFSQAQQIIASMPGYVSHQLSKCVERENRYVLLVNWETLEHHTKGFRGSKQYETWRELLHRFYDPFPEVEHYEAVYPR